MLVTHTLEVTALCPVDDKRDLYECVIRTPRVIKVEDIVDIANSFQTRKAFQEEICEEIHRRLACEVRLVGYHSGVKTEVICGIQGDAK